MQMQDFVTYWRESTMEGIVWGVTFLSVVLLDIDYGLCIGICLSLACVIFMSQKVLVTKLGRIFTTDIYVESNRYQSVSLQSCLGWCVQKQNHLKVGGEEF
jgi:Sulfate permease and related transporters (MFS superfamily)